MLADLHSRKCRAATRKRAARTRERGPTPAPPQEPDASRRSSVRRDTWCSRWPSRVRRRCSSTRAARGRGCARSTASGCPLSGSSAISGARRSRCGTRSRRSWPASSGTRRCRWATRAGSRLRAAWSRPRHRGAFSQESSSPCSRSRLAGGRGDPSFERRACWWRSASRCSSWRTRSWAAASSTRTGTARTGLATRSASLAPTAPASGSSSAGSRGCVRAIRSRSSSASPRSSRRPGPSRRGSWLDGWERLPRWPG